MKISFIITCPYYDNGIKSLGSKCLLSTKRKKIIEKQCYAIEKFCNNTEYEIILVNSIEHTKTQKFVEKKLPQIRYVYVNSENINYGGFYQVDNPKFMSQNKQYTFDLRYMLGLMRIRRIKKDIILETNYAEDMENCIQYYIRDGKILKNNWIAGKTKNYANGGCNGDGRNFETEKIDKEFLFNKYPKYCRLFQRKNGRWDLRLKHYK